MIKSRLFKNKEIIRQLTLVAILVVLVILFANLSPNFLTQNNLINILRQVSITAISSVGMFMIILLGDIDLSVGSVYALVGILCAFIFQATGSTIVTILAAISIGAAIGFISGFITAKSKIPSFVTTLAMMSILRGICYILTGGTPIGVVDTNFTLLGSGYIFNVIPVPIVIMIIVVFIGIFLTSFTRFGRHIYASGGNPQASLWSGLKIDRIKIIVFSIAGFTYGLSALVLAGRLGGGLPAAGQGSELDVIMTVILGGTSLAGGKGKLWVVIIGALMIGVLGTGLTMINVSSYWQQVIKGIIILGAVILDTRAKKNN